MRRSIWPVRFSTRVALWRAGGMLRFGSSAEPQSRTTTMVTQLLRVVRDGRNAVVWHRRRSGAGPEELRPGRSRERKRPPSAEPQDRNRLPMPAASRPPSCGATDNPGSPRASASGHQFFCAPPSPSSLRIPPTGRLSPRPRSRSIPATIGRNATSCRSGRRSRPTPPISAPPTRPMKPRRFGAAR